MLSHVLDHKFYVAYAEYIIDFTVSLQVYDNVF